MIFFIYTEIHINFVPIKINMNNTHTGTTISSARMKWLNPKPCLSSKRGRGGQIKHKRWLIWSIHARKFKPQSLDVCHWNTDDARPRFVVLLVYDIFSSGAETRVGCGGQSVSIKAKRNGTRLRSVDATGNRSDETTTEPTVMPVKSKRDARSGISTWDVLIIV